jgi:hypothetical protein
MYDDRDIEPLSLGARLAQASMSFLISLSDLIATKVLL